jgi:hypothetical protein
MFGECGAGHVVARFADGAAYAREVGFDRRHGRFSLGLAAKSAAPRSSGDLSCAFERHAPRLDARPLRWFEPPPLISRRSRAAGEKSQPIAVREAHGRSRPLAMLNDDESESDQFGQSLSDSAFIDASVGRQPLVGDHELSVVPSAVGQMFCD